MHPLFHPLFIDYVTYFNGNEDYFECHEVLEEYWKNVAPAQKGHPLVGYVQIATGMYHWRRGNVRGAVRIFEKGMALLAAPTDDAFIAYVDVEALMPLLQQTVLRMKSGQAFTPFTLPLTNDALAHRVQRAIDALPPTDAHYICHKHMLRDRSDVLQQRAAKLASKQK